MGTGRTNSSASLSGEKGRLRKRDHRDTMNIIAATHDIDDMTLEKLRGECVKEVKKRNGNFSFDDAVKW